MSQVTDLVLFMMILTLLYSTLDTKQQLDLLLELLLIGDLNLA